MTTPADREPMRYCVVIPTYNNGDSIEHVVRDVLTVTTDIIVVNDGCTDETQTVLEAFPNITVVRHERNLGKGAALKSGFLHATGAGFTHAISFDGDGQHAAKDISTLVDASRAEPDAIVVGVRDLRGFGPPLASRLLRAHSNMWVYLITGRWIPDTQTGLRAFPLAPLAELRQTCVRYDYEVEILIRTVWNGARVIGVPITVTYGPPGQSKFRRVRDSSLVVHLWLVMLMQRIFLPLPVRQTLQRRSTDDQAPTWRSAFRFGWSHFLSGCRQPLRLSLSLAVGVMCAILPIWGLQTVAAALLAHALRLSKAMAIAASALSFPAIIPLVIYASYKIGQFVLTGSMDATHDPHTIEGAFAWTCLIEYLVGSILLSIAAAVLVFALSLFLATAFGAVGRRPDAAQDQSCE